MSKITIWLNLDPEKVDVTYLESKFKSAGYEFVSKALEKGTEEELIEQAKIFDIVIATMEPWNKRTLPAVSDKVRFIQKYGTGVDSIDLETAGKCKIPVSNIPGANAQAVAEVAFMHILNLGRQFSACVNGCKQGIWPSTVTGNELDGKVVGVAGYGRIARHLIRMLSGFDVKILVYDPYVKTAADGQNVEFCASMEELFRNSDVVSLHMPLTESTKGCVNKDLLRVMKKSAYLVNTCRGAIINEADLIAALENRCLAGAGLDVLVTEPPKKDNPLMKMDNVFITSHMGAASLESEHRSQVFMADNIIRFLNGNTPYSVQNEKYLK